MGHRIRNRTVSGAHIYAQRRKTVVREEKALGPRKPEIDSSPLASFLLRWKGGEAARIWLWLQPSSPWNPISERRHRPPGSTKQPLPHVLMAAPTEITLQDRIQSISSNLHGWKKICLKPTGRWGSNCWKCANVKWRILAVSSSNQWVLANLVKTLDGPWTLTAIL